MLHQPHNGQRFTHKKIVFPMVVGPPMVEWARCELRADLGDLTLDANMNDRGIPAHERFRNTFRSARLEEMLKH